MGGTEWGYREHCKEQECRSRDVLTATQRFRGRERPGGKERRGVQSLHTLKAGEDGVVNLALEVVELLDAGRVLGAHPAPEEDERRARPTQRLVRRRGHYVAQLERRAHHAGRHQSCIRRAGESERDINMIDYLHLDAMVPTQSSKVCKESCSNLKVVHYTSTVVIVQ